MDEEVPVEPKSINLEATQAGKLVNSRIGSSVSLDNVQGVDFENSQVSREEFGVQRQMQNANMMFFRRMRGDGGESARNVSGKAVDMPGKFLQPKSYLKLGKTYNSHFQIHNNLKVVSGQDIFFSDKVQGLMHVNMQSTKMASLLRRRCCVAMDMHNYEYLAVVEDPNTCHFVQLETNRVVKTSDFGFAGRELVNTVKFLDDRSGSLKIALGANSNLLRVYDVEAEGDPIHSFRVPYHVNYLCFDKEGKTAALGYDGDYVDLYDFRSGKRTSRLEGHKNHTFALDYHPSNIYLASGNEDETVRIWDLRMMKTTHILPMKSYPAGIVKYRDRGDVLIVGENQQYVHAYDAGNNYNSVSTLDFFGTVIGLDLSPDQRELYVGIGCDEASISGGILRASVGPELRTLGMKDLELKTTSSIQSTQPSSQSKGFFSGGFKLI